MNIDTSELEFLPLGDKVLVIQFELKVSENINNKVHYLAKVLKQECINGVKQIIPTYSSLAIYYNPLSITYHDLKNKIKSLKVMESVSHKKDKRVITIPVIYGGKYGPDLEYVATKSNLTTDEVIQIHSKREYLVYMLGFIASFPYCGDLDDRLSIPRRTKPRLKVQKGTIAIANNQTIVYALETPGGWHNIGVTPIETFNPYNNPPSIFNPGDYVRFIPITLEEMEHWDRAEEERWNLKWNSVNL